VSPTSALLGALFASVWQVAVVAAGFAVLRLATQRPQVRYPLALATLVAQLAWPAWTGAKLLQVRLTLWSPARFETSGQWDWVPLAWSVGALVMLLRTGGGLVVVRRWVTASEAPADAVLSRLEALRARLVVRPVRWGVSRRLTVPLTVGFLRPVVLLPMSLVTAVPGADLELLAAHELMHVRRWDYLVNLGQALVEAVLFFHPAMWWVTRCAREEREYCCDDAVVAGLGAPRSYAQALLALEQSLVPAVDVAVAVPSTGGHLVNRIRRLLNSRPASSSSLSFMVPLAGLVLAVALLGSCAVRNVRGEAPIVTASPEVVPALRTLCADLRADATRPEVAKVDPLDRLTVVLSDLGEKNPHFAAFLGQVATAPVPQRRDTLKRSVSAALGTPWQCPAFDALWDGTELSAAGSEM
jgi:hypothetical protein